MSSQALPLEAKPLSQAERVIDTFVAPRKTFLDLIRSAAWWLPCILVVLVGAGTIAYTNQKIGAAEMVDGMLRHMPALQARVEAAPPDQAAAIRKSMADRNKSNILSIPIGLLVGGFAAAGLLLAFANFAFGGKATYMQMVAVFWYAQLPLLVFDVVILALLAANVGTENYNPLNPAGTNVGYFVEGASPVVAALLNAIDLFSIWIIALQIIGVAKVARIKTSSAAIAVVLIWILYILVLKVAPMALFA